MKPGYGVGVVVAFLVSFAVFLFGVVDFRGLLSLLLLLTGLWTVVAAAALVPPSERVYYASWGVVLAILSATYVISLRYALGLVLIALVVLIVFSYYGRKGPAGPRQGAPAAPPG